MIWTRCTSHSALKAVGLGFELPSFPFADSKTLRCARGFWRSGHSGRTKPPGGRWRMHHRRGRALTARAAPLRSAPWPFTDSLTQTVNNQGLPQMG